MTRVLIIYTGGTIGMAPLDPEVPGSQLAPRPLSELKRYAPILESSDRIQVSEKSLEPPIDSACIAPAHWLEIARIIEKCYEEFDGFVILHGTDTMAYTASALSFIFENLSKPVVLTGSQLPISADRNDASWNLSNAICIAGYPAFGIPRIPEVIIVFADKIIRGCRATKASSTALAGFDSPNFPLLGSTGEHIVVRTDLLAPLPPPHLPFRVQQKLSESVVDLSLFPGIKPDHIRSILNLPDIDAIVLRTFGAGNAPGSTEFLDVIQSVIESGKVIVNITQCYQGMVEMGLYKSSSGLLERGVTSGSDMTPEAALTKLMCALGSKAPHQHTLTRMQVNQRGEQSENLFDLPFGTCKVPTSTYSNSIAPHPGLHIGNYSKGIVRITGLTFPDLPGGETVHLRVFLNERPAKAPAEDDDPECLFQQAIHWQGTPISISHTISHRSATSSLRKGNITLTIATPPGKHFQFTALHFSVFTRASF